MTDSPHLDHVRRSALARVEEILQIQAPQLQCEHGPIETYFSFYGGPPGPVNGLLVRAPSIEGHAQVLVVATRRTLPEGRGGFSADRRVWIRDINVDYSLGQGFDSLMYELTILEDPWEGRGHSRSDPAGMHRDEDPASIASIIAWWSRYPQEFAAPPPGPISPRRLEGLRAVARARLDCLRGATPVHEIDQAVVADLTPESRDELEADLSNLLPVNLLWNIPRDDRGRLDLGCMALLHRYESLSPQPPGRRLWLCVQGPSRRKDPQEVALRLLSLIGENHTQRWDEARWLWDRRAQDLSLEERWGIDDAERVAECVALQDEGKIGEALALYGVELEPRLAKLLRGVPLQFGLRDKTAQWAARLQEGLRGSAPWLLAQARERSPFIDAEWRKAQHRPTNPSRLRLLELGGQNQQRRPGVFLAPGEKTPRLILDWSGSNDRVPAHAWVRPVDYDLVRFGLIDRSAIPLGTVIAGERQNQ